MQVKLVAMNNDMAIVHAMDNGFMFEIIIPTLDVDVETLLEVLPLFSIAELSNILPITVKRWNPTYAREFSKRLSTDIKLKSVMVDGRFRISPVVFTEVPIKPLVRTIIISKRGVFR